MEINRVKVGTKVRFFADNSKESYLVLKNYNFYLLKIDLKKIKIHILENPVKNWLDTYQS